MNSESNSGLLFPARPSLGRNVLWIASVALIYFAAAQLSLLLELRPEGIAAIWPPSGIFLSAILLTRRDLRPWLVGTVFIADFIAERLAGTPFLVSALYSLSLTGDAVLSCWLLLRFVGEPITFRRVRHVAGWLALSVLFSNALTSLVAAAASLLLPGTHPFWSSWQWWAVPEGVGNLLVTPFILTWAAWAKTRLRVRYWPRVFETAALFIPMALLNFALFSYLSGHRLFALFLPYATFPFLLRAALRFGVRGVSTILIMLAAIAVPFATSGRIPGFSFAPGVPDEVIVAQLFLAVLAVPSLFLAAAVTERQQAHEALHQALGKTELIVNAAGEGIYGVDLEGRMTFINPVAALLLGYEREALLGQSLHAVMHHTRPDGTPYPLEECQICAAFKDGLSRCVSDEVFWRKDGASFPVEYTSTPVVDESNRPTGAVVVFRDITERKRAEESLRDNEHRWAFAIEGMGTGVLDWDIATGRMQFSDRWLNMTGYSRDELPPRLETLTALVHPEDLPLAWADVQEVIGGRKSVHTVEHRLKHKQGHWMWIQARAMVSAWSGRGEPLRMIGTHVDISERKRAEEELREQAALLNAANDTIYLRRLDHTVTYWNAGAERLYGWTRDEALGRKITELGAPNAAAFAAAHAALLEQGSWSGELKIISKQGKDLVMFCRWTLLRDEQGQPMEVLAINSDVTEHKRLEAQYLRAQRMESVGTLAGGIAHDLNNILAPILMSAALLRDTVSDPESREMLNTVEACAQRGADIIKQLLTFARGKPAARVSLPVRHLLREMDKIIRATFPRNIQPRVNAPDDLWPILGDTTQIHQALINLCVNARDAMPDGGTLTLAADNVTVDEVFAAAAPDAKPGTYVVVSVADTGMGIPPENLDRIFDPFFTTKEFGRGTGLGLATVLGIVRGHGGFLRVNSRVGEGTAFEFYLPASLKVKASDASERETPPPRGQGELILVVDDEAALRVVVQRTLEKHGYRVLAAGEGTEALALFGRHHAEVRAVVVDMMMPGMDGPKLVQALRQLDARLPILGMTGLGERTGMKGLAELHLPVLLTKPFAGVKLLAALSQALTGSRPAPEVGPGEEP